MQPFRRKPTSLFLLLSLLPSLSSADPFSAPHLLQSNPLLQRSTCPGSYAPCTTIGVPSACCPLSATCQFDNSGSIACCEFRSTCSGSLNSGSKKKCATGSFACGNEFPGGCCKDGERCGAGTCLAMQGIGNGTNSSSTTAEGATATARAGAGRVACEVWTVLLVGVLAGTFV